MNIFGRYTAVYANHPEAITRLDLSADKLDVGRDIQRGVIEEAT